MDYHRVLLIEDVFEVVALELGEGALHLTREGCRRNILSPLSGANEPQIKIELIHVTVRSQKEKT